MAGPAHHLDYDVPVRRTRKWPVYLFCTAIVGIAIYRFVESYSLAWSIHWQELCSDRALRSYSPKSGTVAFSDDPAVLSALATRANDYEMQAHPYPYVGYVAPARTHGQKDWHAVVFMHLRTASPNPPRFIVVIAQAWRGDRPNERIVLLNASNFEPATAFHLRHWLYNCSERMLINVRSSDTLTILTGKPDPNDPARFTIEVIANGSHFFVDGRIRPDDTVELLAHSGLSNLIPGGDPIPVWWPTATHPGNNIYDPLDRSSVAAGPSTTPATKP